MDKASHSINRHMPQIPEPLLRGLPLLEERMGNKVARNILRTSRVGEITKWYKGTRPFIASAQLTVTQEMLNRAETANNGNIDDVKPYLESRGISPEIAAKYKMCSTTALTANLTTDEIENLSLILPTKFAKTVKSRTIEGISIPCYFDSKFYGYATRIIGENAEHAKYAFTCPNRLCFGTDFSKREEIFIVEGVFDAIALLERGMNPLGMGDSQPNYYKMWIASHFQKINLLFDGDYAGCLGAMKAYIMLNKLFEVHMNDISVLSLPDGEDPARCQNWTQISYRDLLDRASTFGVELGHED